MNVGGLQRSGEERGVVGIDQGVTAINVAELELANNLGNNGLKLGVGKVLTNASVTASAERQVGRS